MDLNMYYTMNLVDMNYFGMEIPEMDGQIKIELSCIISRSAWEGSDWISKRIPFHNYGCTAFRKLSDSYCKKIPVESYENKEGLVEYTLANPVHFKDVVEFVNSERLY